MSLFDFPRINFKGTIQLNPGTANNDDYAQPPSVTMPASWGPYAGQAFGLFDSIMVKARTYGMSDAAFIEWVQQPQAFSGGQRLIPAEWNYYGDMGSSATTKIIGVQTGPGQSYAKANPSVPVSSLIGASLTFDGGITDVNSEGSPPSTQFFIDNMNLMNGKDVAIDGAPTKGACQWINFYRNVNLTADGGAGGYIYHVLLTGKGTTINIPGISPKARGIVIRYYLYRRLPNASGAALVELYKKGDTNPTELEIAGTIAPLRDDEQILTGPTGRLLIANTPNILTPPGTNNNGGGIIALAPAVLQQKGNMLSADFMGTFPDYYKKPANPKFDFGEVRLAVTGGGTTVPIAPVPYADTKGGDQRGWIFDFDISNADAQKALQDPSATFSLLHLSYGTVLSETEYYFPSNQQAIYAEQNGPGDVFLNQGTTEPATVSVYRYGKLLSRSECPPITVWQYRSTPIQSPGNAVAINSNFKPGDPILADTSQPGNCLFTFTINDADNPAPGGYPPQNYGTFQNPPWVTNAPLISLRILPNEDFSRYYVNPTAEKPVGNDLLTFDVLYEKVLRVYYLLFPAMNAFIPLNSEEKVKAKASAILERTKMSYWMTTGYMPRTRDLSQSRKTLLQAWCRKVGGKG